MDRNNAERINELVRLLRERHGIDLEPDAPSAVLGEPQSVSSGGDEGGFIDDDSGLVGEMSDFWRAVNPTYNEVLRRVRGR